MSRAEKVFKAGLPLNWRKERNVPKKFVKAAVFEKVGDKTGYFVYHQGLFFPIEFDFTHCFWFIVKYNNQKSCWESYKLPTQDFGLNIPDSEVTDQSEWGPIDDGCSDKSGDKDTKSEGQPESIDIKVSTKEEERSKKQLGKQAEFIPTLSGPRSHTATSRLPPITTVMTTQTTIKPMQTVPPKEETSTIQRGGGPPGDPPDPRWFGGSRHPFNLPRESGGGGGGGGGGGNGGGDHNDQGSGPKLSGKEPVIFDGDHSKAKAFILEWTIYTMLNSEMEVMAQAFSRMMLFLMFIKGPNVQEWVGAQVGWLGRCLLAGGRKTDEYLYDTIMESFNTTFMDTMSLQKAKAEFQSIKMEGGDLDTYIAKFKRLVRITSYNLHNQMVLDWFSSGLISGLYIAIVNGPDEPRNWTEWT